MAEVSVRNTFETLVKISKMNDSERQLILRGSCPSQNPYIAYGDRVLLDFPIGLTDEETHMSLAELNQKFSNLHLIKFPLGQTECLKSQFNGKTFLMFYYHVYNMDDGIALYEKLKWKYFDEK